MYVAPTAPHVPATPAERHKGAFAEEQAPRPPSFDEEDVSDKPSWIREAKRFSTKQVSDIDDKYRKRLESMLAVDEMVASLVQELEATDELENTFIFFTSDNGMSLGEHRRRSGKRLPYEELAHVPLFVRGPGLAAGSKIEKLTLNTDFAPTFADIASTRFRADGRSLLPLLSYEESPSWRTAVLLEGFPQAEGDEEGDNEGGRGKDRTVLSPAYGAIRTESYKYVEYDNGEKELYDLEADPYELDNVYEGVDPSLLRGLKAKLDALRGCSDEGCREAEDAS
jgi:N-acetylglucosamine-6-sulfatase